MRAPYIYDISHLRVNREIWSALLHHLLHLGLQSRLIQSPTVLSHEASSSFNGNKPSVNQTTPRILRYPKFRYGPHKKRPLVPALSQKSPPCIAPSSYFILDFNIIIESMHSSSKGCFSSGFPKNPECISRYFHACHVGTVSISYILIYVDPDIMLQTRHTAWP